MYDVMKIDGGIFVFDEGTLVAESDGWRVIVYGDVDEEAIRAALVKEAANG